MSYRLISLTGAGTGATIGVYPTYGDALAARADDVLSQLTAAGGWWTRVEHTIVGPGAHGPRTEHPCCTELGVPTDRAEPPGPDDLHDAAQWLKIVHRD